ALAGRVLLPEGRWLLPAAVLGASASQLLVARLLLRGQPTPATLVLLGCVPAVCHGLSVAGVLKRLSPLRSERVGALFGFLGMATVALAVALGFLIFRGEGLGVSLNWLSIPVALVGVPVLAAGLLVHNGLAGDRTRAALRTAGTGVALGGVLIL